MIAFFRKIRKSLLGSGRAGRYLPYAIGEIVLVMIGILLALQVNTWNENRVAKIALRKSLESLISDLESDAMMWKTLKKNQIFRFYSLQHLLKLAGEEGLAMGPDEVMLPYEENDIWQGEFPEQADRKFLMLTFRWSYRVGVSDPNTSVLDELKGTGQYSSLSAELKGAVYEYYRVGTLRFGTGTQNMTNGVIDRWLVSLEKDGIIPMDLTSVADPVGLIRGQKDRIAMVRALARSAWFNSFSLESLNIQLKELIALIHQELNKI